MIYRIASLVALLRCCVHCAGAGPPNSQSPATLPNAVSVVETLAIP